MAAALAQLLEPAARIRPQGLGQGDREEVDGQEQQARRQQSRQARGDHGAGLPRRTGDEQRHRGPAERVVPPAGAEQLILAAPHRAGVRIGQIVVSAEMQQAVDNVQRQLVPGIDADLRRRRRRHLGRDDQLAGQGRVVGLGKREADDVRRPVVTQVRRLIAWIVAWSTRAIEIEARRAPFGDQGLRGHDRDQLGGLDAQVALRVADLDLDRVPAILGFHHRLPASSGRTRARFMPSGARGT